MLSWTFLDFAGVHTYIATGECIAIYMLILIGYRGLPGKSVLKGEMINGQGNLIYCHVTCLNLNIVMEPHLRGSASLK